MDEVNSWKFVENSGPYLTDDTLFVSVKATRQCDGKQFGQWAIVVRAEDIPAAINALRALLELQIASLEKDERRDDVAPR